MEDLDPAQMKDIDTVKHEKKIRGFFTVTIYIFAVSFLAIVLSFYYFFVWTNPNIAAYCSYIKVLDTNHDDVVTTLELRFVLNSTKQGRQKMNNTSLLILLKKWESEEGGIVPFGLELIEAFGGSVGHIRNFMVMVAEELEGRVGGLEET